MTPHHHTLASPEGSLVMVEHSDSVLQSEVTGVFDLHLATYFLTTVNAWLSRRGVGLRAFHDWSRMTSYDDDGRRRITSWALQHRRAFSSVELLVESKIVTLGVHLANLALGGMLRVHDSRAAFEDSLRGALAAPPSSR